MEDRTRNRAINTQSASIEHDDHGFLQGVSRTDARNSCHAWPEGHHHQWRWPSFLIRADISELLANIDHQTMLENYRAFVNLEQLEIPVISAIRGVCLGSAFELALFSHFRICSEDAVLGLPESTFNLMPGIGGIQRVSALTGKAIAMEIILHGNTFTGGDALEMGLVDAVVPKREVLPLSNAFANAFPGIFRWKTVWSAFTNF